MKKTVALMLLLAITALLSGCWNYREIESLSIVAGAGIDRSSETNEYTMYIEVVKLEGGQEPKMAPELIKSSGKTIFDAVRNVINISGRRLYWSHAQMVVISEDVAKDSIVDVLDWYMRDQEPRLTVDIYITKDAKMEEIFHAKPLTEPLISYEIHTKGENEYSLAKAPKVEVFQMADMITAEGQNAYAPAVTLTKQGDKESTEICGMYMFKGDKAVGHLNAEDTEFFLFAINNIEGGLLVKKDIGGREGNISLEIFSNTTDVKPIYSDGKLVMEIKTKTEASIAENGSTQDYMSESGQKLLKEEMEKYLAERITDVIKKVQNESDADIFGFGSAVNNQMPELWKQLKDKWSEEFKKIEVNVDSKIKFRNSGTIIKSLEVGH